MEQTFSSALQLLVIGMLTVFVILFLVILIGNILIRIINRIMPEEVHKTVQSAKNSVSASSVEPQKMAVIASAVSILTKGKGKVERVEKI